MAGALTTPSTCATAMGPPTNATYTLTPEMKALLDWKCEADMLKCTELVRSWRFKAAVKDWQRSSMPKSPEAKEGLYEQVKVDFR